MSAVFQRNLTMNLIRFKFLLNNKKEEFKEKKTNFHFIYIYFQIKQLNAKMKAKPHCWWYFVVILTIGKLILLTFSSKKKEVFLFNLKIDVDIR